MNKLKLLFWRWGWEFRARHSKELRVGEVFPGFALTDLRGQRHTLSDPSSPFYTMLWFTNFCEDCSSRIPFLEELNWKTQGKFRILAVSILKTDDPVHKEVEKLCSFPILLDPHDIVATQLGLPHPPATCPLHNLFILNRKGRIVFRHHLSALTHEAFRKVWRELMYSETEVVNALYR